MPAIVKAKWILFGLLSLKILNHMKLISWSEPNTAEQHWLVMVMVVTSRVCNNSHKRTVTIILTEV
jgi:hypothetical protein